MRAGALFVSGVALAATTYLVLSGRGALTPAPTDAVTPAAERKGIDPATPDGKNRARTI